MENADLMRANDLFDHTISLCSSELLSKSPDEIRYVVYEEFDTYSWSFLHENTLVPLLNAGLISEEIFKLASELRELSGHLFASGIDRSVEELKNNVGWQMVFSLCERIMELKKGNEKQHQEEK